MFRKIRSALTVLLIILGSLLLIWALAPVKKQVSSRVISPTAMQVTQSGEAAGAAFLEPRQITVLWPKSMRIGEKASITLVFGKVDHASSVQLPSGLSDAYDKFNLMAEGRFEAAGIHFSPIYPTRESLLAGQALKFQWDISVNSPGKHEGTLWLSLRFLPLDGSTPIQVPIYVQAVSIQTISLLGLKVTSVIILAGACLFVGLLLVFSDMIIRRVKKPANKGALVA